MPNIETSGDNYFLPHIYLKRESERKSGKQKSVKVEKPSKLLNRLSYFQIQHVWKFGQYIALYIAGNVYMGRFSGTQHFLAADVTKSPDFEGL